MTTTLDPTKLDPATGLARPARSHRIDVWEPEDPAFWAAGGGAVARRNLVFSILSEHIGFSVWTMWSVLVLFLGPKYGLKPEDKFLLTSVPVLVGSVLRLPYTFAVATFGGRNFASSMANINAFYPQHLKGRALGLNAGGGNLGVAAVQLAGLLVLATAGKDHPRYLIAAYLPLIVVATVLAWSRMDNLTAARNDKRAMRNVCRDPHTWIISLLYVGTFGSFIGFGFAFGQVLQVQFKSHDPTPLDAAYLTFVGPLLGSFARPLEGAGADPVASDRQARRSSSALIGIAGAIGAFGGVLVNVAFRQSFLETKAGNAAYVAFLCFYALCFAVTWVVYLRPSARRLVGV